MSSLEQLQPFFSLCQACGMIPYTTEYDSDTGKLIEFAFSFKHFITWWFVFVSILQLATLAVWGKPSTTILQNLSTDGNTPITLVVLSSVTTLGYLSQLIISRWIVMRHHGRLRIALKTAQEVEKLFEQTSRHLSVSKHLVLQRFVIGFTLILITATGTIVCAIPMLQPISADMGIFLLTVSFFSFALMNTLVDCLIMLIHLCYYITAHYIEILQSQLRVASGEHTQIEKFTAVKNSSTNMLKRTLLIFENICQVNSEMNSIFSVPVLILLVTKFISVLSNAFAFLFAATSSNSTLNTITAMMLLNFHTDCIKLMIILFSADLPIYQLQLLRERVFTRLHSGFSQFSKKTLTMAFLVQIDEDRIRLSAAGLFKVGMHLIPPLLGAVVTYMVVLFQN